MRAQLPPRGPRPDQVVNRSDGQRHLSRLQRGEIGNGLVRTLVRRDSMILYYLCFLAATGVLVVLTLIVRAVTPLAADQSYFVVVLSVLLMHYYFDHFLFSQPKLID